MLRAAKVAEAAGKEVRGVRRWALDVQGRSNHNKATCALALASICGYTKTPRHSEPITDVQAHEREVCSAR